MTKPTDETPSLSSGHADRGETPETDACIAEYEEGILDFAWTLTDLARSLERRLREALGELAREKQQTKIMLDSYAEENQRLFDRAERAEAARLPDAAAALDSLGVVQDKERYIQGIEDAIKACEKYAARKRKAAKNMAEKERFDGAENAMARAVGADECIGEIRALIIPDSDDSDSLAPSGAERTREEEK